jgi:hypothetical protein
MKKLKVEWSPKIEDDLHSFVVCGILTQEQSDKLLKEFKDEKV